MKLINTTKKTCLADSLIEAKTFKQQILGLIVHAQPIALLIHTRFGIHTFGMKYTIDILILDHTNHVVHIKEKLTPNRIFFWNPLFSKIIELPQGSIQKSKTTIGDIVRVIPSKEGI